MWPRIWDTTRREREKKGEDNKWDGKKKPFQSDVHFTLSVFVGHLAHGIAYVYNGGSDYFYVSIGCCVRYIINITLVWNTSSQEPQSSTVGAIPTVAPVRSRLCLFDWLRGHTAVLRNTSAGAFRFLTYCCCSCCCCCFHVISLPNIQSVVTGQAPLTLNEVEEYLGKKIKRNRGQIITEAHRTP